MPDAPDPPSAASEPTDQNLRLWLGAVQTIAVVGLSPNPQRDSHRVALRLQSLGWTVVAVNPTASQVLGQPCYASLSEAAANQGIDLVNVFRRSEEVPGLVQEAIAIGAKGVWTQLGVVHEEAARTARKAGLWVVQDRCIQVEAQRLGLRRMGR